MLTLECANKVLYQSYTSIYSKFPRNGTALTEEQLGQHEILRAQTVCGRALRMTSSAMKGAAPHKWELKRIKKQKNISIFVKM